MFSLHVTLRPQFTANSVAYQQTTSYTKYHSTKHQFSGLFHCCPTTPEYRLCKHKIQSYALNVRTRRRTITSAVHIPKMICNTWLNDCCDAVNILSTDVAVRAVTSSLGEITGNPIYQCTRLTVSVKQSRIRVFAQCRADRATAAALSYYTATSMTTEYMLARAECQISILPVPAPDYNDIITSGHSRPVSFLLPCRPQPLLSPSGLAQFERGRVLSV